MVIVPYSSNTFWRVYIAPHVKQLITLQKQLFRFLNMYMFLTYIYLLYTLGFKRLLL